MKSKYIVLALSACILLFGCQGRGPKTIPDELLGVWKTSAPKYEGCFIEIRKDSIAFLNMSHLGSMYSNDISKIEFASEGKEMLYTIHYKKRGEEEYQFPFYYYPQEGGAIRFKNQIKIKWVKTDAQTFEELFAGSGS